MVIAVGGCDNVEWGGLGLSIVPPPDKAGDSGDAVTDRDLPDGPVLFYVRRDSIGATVIPVGHVTGTGLAPINPGDDIDAFGARFMRGFLTPGTRLTLYRRGQRMGTVTLDSARVPPVPVCRPLPRARGSLSLTADAEGVTEFLALDQTDAPEGRLAGRFEQERRMAVVGDMLVGEMFRARGVEVPSTTAARRQLQPFPLTASPEPGFAATYIVDDSVGLGGDNVGASVFVVFTPQGQTGYDAAFVGFSDYGDGGKAAPRIIDFLDWDRDEAGNVEFLLEIFGTRTSWFRAVGFADGRWQTIFQDRCDPRTAPMDTSEAGSEAQSAEDPRSSRQRALDSIPDIEPTIQLSDPTATQRLRDTTPLTVRRDRMF
jgi:hypothetical protein